LNNVYANAQSIRQDIYRIGMQVEGSVRPQRRWDVSGMYRAAYYSDYNALDEFSLRSAHLLIEGRQRLRGLVDYSFTSFSRQTMFGPDPDTLVGTIHPYFAPRGFSFLTAGLEWKQWLSCDTFKGADEFYYLAYCGAGVDSYSRGYFLSNAALMRDVTSWFTCAIETHVTAASVYHETGAIVSGIIRFP
jgi:hypothetical protein